MSTSIDNNNNKNSNNNTQNQREHIVITPASFELLKFFTNSAWGLPDIIEHLEEIFTSACFYSIHDLGDKEKGALATQHHIIHLLKKLQQEM